MPAGTAGPEGRRRRLPWVVLGLATLATIASTTYVGVTINSREQARFEAAVQASTLQMHARLATYVVLLRGVSGLFASHTLVGRDSFRAYVDHLGLKSAYPGIQGIGYAVMVNPT